MNRNFSIKVILFICFVVNIIFAQNTFERSYPSFGQPPFIGLKTMELPDGNFLIAGSRSSASSYSNSEWFNLFIIKIDKNGYTLWRKEISTVTSLFRPSNQVLITPQNEILVLTIQSVDSIHTLNIKKFDFDGNETLNTNLISDSTIVGCAISSLNDSGYLIAYGDRTNGNPISILKIDLQLNLIWHKKIKANIPSNINGSFSINKWGTNKYAVGFRSTILQISSNGDSLFTYPRRHNFIAETTDGDIVVSGANTLTKIDSMRNLVWTLNFENDPGPVIQSADGSYLIIIRNTDYDNPYSVQKIDEARNIIWTKLIKGIAFNILETADNSILMTGVLRQYYWPQDHAFNLWNLKTDPLGNYNSINLITPIGYENILTFNNYKIGWHSNGVERVNLFYSIDDGNNWDAIAENIDADTSEYTWTVPLLYTDSIKIKISDSDNPDIFNYSEYPIYVSIYQPTDYISTNEILMWIGNNGMGSHDPRTDGSGFYWPGGDSATIAAIYTDGLVWGGKVNGEIRVNGNTWRNGLTPGKILIDGTANNPLATQSKIFKIKKDWHTLPESNLKNRLEYDYNHWPIEAGAPWDDVNEDGVYTPDFDKPKCFGDETLFYVANDLDTATSQYTYGSDPMGLEFQTTVFGFNRDDLKDVVFKKYKVINISETDITDMYFTYWADVDMGDANDDYEGFDTIYNMGYVFNGDNNDNQYYGTPPPAVAHMVVQGPIIPALDIDSARYNNGWKYGHKNLGMTSAGMMLKNYSSWPGDPYMGHYEGTLQFYNYMNGLNTFGDSLINPITNLPTIWPLCGDPVSGVGWYEGDGWPVGPYPGDHRYHVPTGPFNLAVGDTQEVVYAIMMAKGTDNINSITKLRELASHVQEFYNTELVDILNTKQTIAPTGYTLYQNYPNPFNPKTTIEYEVPEKSFVTIKIYDILGREVQTLVNNEEKVRYKYKVVFDASSLSSGVYFYRIQAGSFTETKKMMVLK